MLVDFVENRLLWIDSHLFSIWSWDLSTDQQIWVDEFKEDDRGLSGIAVFEVM